MGRYFRFTVGNQTWSRQFNGKDDPGAPLVELDINVAPADQGPQGSVTVWGVPLSLVSQQNQFFNKPFKLEGGMSHGLPLATSLVCCVAERSPGHSRHGKPRRNTSASCWQ
jgi:hypothetical protein